VMRACLIVLLLALTLDMHAEIEERHHGGLRFGGEDEFQWSYTVFVRQTETVDEWMARNRPRFVGPAEIVVVMRDQRQRVVRARWWQDEEGARAEVMVDGVAGSVSQLRRWQQPWVEVFTGSRLVALDESTPPEELDELRALVFAEVEPELLAVVETITSNSNLTWAPMFCPEPPRHDALSGWHCDCSLDMVDIDLAPDCAFDASVGHPCDAERAAVVRDAAERGVVRSRY
jgi:hypothetical protein